MKKEKKIRRGGRRSGSGRERGSGRKRERKSVCEKMCEQQETKSGADREKKEKGEERKKTGRGKGRHMNGPRRTLVGFPHVEYPIDHVKRAGVLGGALLRGVQVEARSLAGHGRLFLLLAKVRGLAHELVQVQRLVRQIHLPVVHRLLHEHEGGVLEAVRVAPQPRARSQSLEDQLGNLQGLAVDAVVCV